MSSLPVDGESGWGDVLNAYLSSQASQISSTANSISNHASNNPSDPHGDRAYASSLVNPITSGVNTANGFVKLNGSGYIPPSLINGSAATGGMYKGIYDAVTMYGAVPGTNSDQSAAIQNALNAAGSAGGGIVHIGPGTYSISNYLVMPSNTWLIMTPDTTLQRIIAGTNAPYMITNVQFGTSNTPSSNIRISGGRLNSYGSQSISSACTNIFIIQSFTTLIEDVYSYSPFSAGPAIEVNGCNYTFIKNCVFDGVSRSSGSSGSPAIRINSSSGNTTPTGLAGGFYNGSVVNGCFVSGCTTAKISLASGPFGAFAASDKVDSLHNTHNFVVISSCATMYSSPSQAIHLGTAQWNNSLYSANAWFEASGVWNTVNTDAGWSNVASFAPGLQYRLTADGNVQFSGALSKTAAFTSNQSINNGAPLPNAFQPTNKHVLSLHDDLGSVARVEYNPDGILFALASVSNPAQFVEVDCVCSLL